MRLMSIEKVRLIVLKSNPIQLAIQVSGYSSTSGWEDIHLEKMEENLSEDGILDLELIGTPPTKNTLQVITPVTADIAISDDVDKIVAVHVHSRTNSVLELMGNKVDRSEFTNDMTTLALGEEEIGLDIRRTPITTFPFGEEFNPPLDPPWKPFVGEKPPGLESDSLMGLANIKNPFGIRKKL